ncbi:MAG: 4Fe-4S ferredoxin, partial [Rhodobacterales bacterium CG_4_9_14_3_um_filter_71_31]
PFGAVALNEGACTLCLACVSACPVRALGDDADRPLLSFDESLCVQCGLCAATCPEDALTLIPRLDFAALTAPPRVLKQEPPFCCVECGKPFGNRASIARVQEKLKGHWMFSGPEGAARARVLEMCEDCRVSAVVTESFDPHGLPERRVRTAEDYRGEQGDK